MTCSHFNGVLQIPVYRQGRWYGRCLACGEERPADAAPWPEEAGKAAALAVQDMAMRRFGPAFEGFRAAEAISGDPRCCLAAMLCSLGVSWCGDEHQPTFSADALPHAPLDAHPCMLALREKADRLSRAEMQGVDMLLAQLQPILNHLYAQEGLAACDVFLCYRRTAVNVRDALALYRRLTSKGLRVFCADETTRGKTQEEFESQVYHALRTAEYLVIFPGEGEDALTPWMRNELDRAACPPVNRFVCSDHCTGLPGELRDARFLPLSRIGEELLTALADSAPSRLWERAVQALAADDRLTGALRLLERASARGDLRARLLLATLYGESRLVDGDAARALHYSRLAASADASVRQAVFSALDEAEKARSIPRRRALVCIAADVSTAGLDGSRALLQQLLTTMQADRRLAGCEMALIGFDRHARIIEPTKPLGEYGLPEIAARRLHTLREDGRDQVAYAAKGLRLAASISLQHRGAGLLPLAVLLTPGVLSDAPAALPAALECTGSTFARTVRLCDAAAIPGCIDAFLSALG
ncbi:MAG: hypothetical protein IKK57_07770 [Clostridia bacterium]|nr:hypothetical protein [Clostridia bacterium]